MSHLLRTQCPYLQLNNSVHIIKSFLRINESWTREMAHWVKGLTAQARGPEFESLEPMYKSDKYPHKFLCGNSLTLD